MTAKGALYVASVALSLEFCKFSGSRLLVAPSGWTLWRSAGRSGRECPDGSAARAFAFFATDNLLLYF